MEFKTKKKIEKLRDLVDNVHTFAGENNARGRNEADIPPDDKKMLESVYTSTGTKMLQHLDRLEDAKRGVWRPITLQISPTDNCNLECGFCSTWNREGDTIPIGDLEDCIDDFVDVGPILSAEITGGGDPTMYKELPRLVDYLDSKDVDVGMITNGLLLNKVPQDTLDTLKWMRISMSFLDAENYYGNDGDTTKRDPLDSIVIPEIKGTLGLSYVWTPGSDISKLEKISEFAKRSRPSFVRIVPNCQSPEQQAEYKEAITPLMEEFPGMFFQSKSYDIHDACRIGRLKPFLNSDGKLYQCSASPLYTGNFSEAWKIGSMKDVKDIWPSNLPVMDTSNCYAGKCFYAGQNRMLHGLEVEVPHDKFI